MKNFMRSVQSFTKSYQLLYVTFISGTESGHRGTESKNGLDNAVIWEMALAKLKLLIESCLCYTIL